MLTETVTDGLLSPDEYGHMAIPTYYRTPREWTECLAPGSDFAVKNRLRLLRQQPAVLSDPYFESFQETGDANAFARAYAGFLRAFSEPCLFKSLRQERTAENRQSLIDSFYQRIEEAIAKEPVKYVCHWQLMLLEICKDSPGNTGQ